MTKRVGSTLPPNTLVGAMQPQMALDIVHQFCASLTKTGTPVPKTTYEQIEFFRNRGTHYRHDHRAFADLFSAIADYADATVGAVRPSDSISLNCERIQRERKLYTQDRHGKKPEDAFKNAEITIGNAKEDKSTAIKRDAARLEHAIEGGLKSYKEGNKRSWVGIASQRPSTRGQTPY